jgi:putative redox protein
MHTVKLRFDNGRGEQLAAMLDRPVDDAPVAYAIFAHCFTCSKNYKAVRHISRALAAEGFAVLGFDFTGLGESEGEFAETSFTSNVDDIVAAADFLTRDHGAPTVLIGHSLGGAAVMMAASRIPSRRRISTTWRRSSNRRERQSSATAPQRCPSDRDAFESGGH